MAAMDFATGEATSPMEIPLYIEELKRRAKTPAEAAQMDEDGRILAASTLILSPGGAILEEVPLSACSDSRKSALLSEAGAVSTGDSVRVPSQFGRWSVHRGQLFWGTDPVQVNSSAEVLSLMGGMIVFERVK